MFVKSFGLGRLNVPMLNRDVPPFFFFPLDADAATAASAFCAFLSSTRMACLQIKDILFIYLFKIRCNN